MIGSSNQQYHQLGNRGCQVPVIWKFKPELRSELTAAGRNELLVATMSAGDGGSNLLTDCEAMPGAI